MPKTKREIAREVDELLANPASHEAIAKGQSYRDWWSAGQRWLEQEALKEAAAQKRAWVKKGRSAQNFRYDPPQWHRDAVAALGRNDEETFKAIKLEQIGFPRERGARASGQ